MNTEEDFINWQDMWDSVRDTPEFNQTPQPDWTDVAEIIVEDFKTPNPILASTVGTDQDDPKPAWVSEFINEISELKQKLYDLEVKRNKEDAANGEWVEKCHHPDDKEISKRIESIKSEIDNLSNSLGIEAETPWPIKDSK